MKAWSLQQSADENRFVETTCWGPHGSVRKQNVVFFRHLICLRTRLLSLSPGVIEAITQISHMSITVYNWKAVIIRKWFLCGVRQRRGTEYRKHLPLSIRLTVCLDMRRNTASGSNGLCHFNAQFQLERKPPAIQINTFFSFLLTAGPLLRDMSDRGSSRFQSETHCVRPWNIKDIKCTVFSGLV